MEKINAEEFLEAIAFSVDGVDRADLSLDLPIKEIPNLDSLGRVIMVTEISERFNVDIGMGDLASSNSLEDLKNAAEKLRSEN